VISSARSPPVAGSVVAAEWDFEGVGDWDEFAASAPAIKRALSRRPAA